MKKIGILTGVNYGETIEYHQLLCQLINREGRKGVDYLLPSSPNYASLEAFVRREYWKGVADCLINNAVELETKGADFLMIPCPLLHRVASQIVSRTKIPLLHMVEVIAQEIKKHNLTKIGILGSANLAQDTFHQKCFLKHGIEIVFPKQEESQKIERILTEELVFGILEDESKRICLDIIQNLTRQGVTGLIYASTEIKQLVQSCNDFKLVLFDSKSLHCQRAARIALELEPLPKKL